MNKDAARAKLAAMSPEQLKALMDLQGRQTTRGTTAAAAPNRGIRRPAAFGAQDVHQAQKQETLPTGTSTSEHSSKPSEPLDAPWRMHMISASPGTAEEGAIEEVTRRALKHILSGTS